MNWLKIKKYLGLAEVVAGAVVKNPEKVAIMKKVETIADAVVDSKIPENSGGGGEKREKVRND